MRTSLNNIKAIDDYLAGHLAPGDALLFEAKLLLNTGLKDDMHYQQTTYAVIKQYSRKKIKDEVIAVQKTLSAAPQHRGFMQRIAEPFKKY